MTEIRFTATIAPKAKGRGRTAVRGGRAIVYTPAPTRAWEASFARLSKPHAPIAALDEPLEVQLLFVLPRPTALRARRCPTGLIPASGRPDVDNYAKAAMDALRAWWVDDARVVTLVARKAYAELHGAARVEVIVRSARPIEEAPDAPSPATAALDSSPIAAGRATTPKRSRATSTKRGADRAAVAAVETAPKPVKCTPCGGAGSLCNRRACSWCAGTGRRHR